MKELFVMALLASSVSLNAATGIDRMSAYEGTWKSEVEHFATAYSKAGKESSTVRNDCWHSTNYFTCAQIVDGESKALLVFAYNSKEDNYSIYAIPSDGGDAHKGKLLIKENVWTFPWEDKDTYGKAVFFRVVNVFSGPKTIEYRLEFSSDQAHWIVAAKGTERKQ